MTPRENIMQAITAQRQGAVKAMSQAERVKAAKEKRFTTSARILSGKAIKVHVVDEANDAPAKIDMKSFDLTLNEAHPRAKNAVDALIYDRAKMFHEIDHAEFTAMIDYRATLADKAQNAQAFLALSNILEDGRIERLGRQKWEGTGDYLDAVLPPLMANAGNTPINGLVLYVRKKLYRNESEKAYWQPFQAQIDKAVWDATERELLDIAFKIAEAMPKQQGNKPEPPQGEGEGEGEGESEESEGQGQGEGESEETGSEHGNATETTSEISEETKEKIDQIVEEARERIQDDASAEVDAILEEAKEPPSGEQQYADGSEETISDELSQMFSSLLVEVNRVKFSQSKEGILNTNALTNALTNRKCFQTREETLGAPYVALLLDTSGSVGNGNLNVALTDSARILNGALQKAKVNVRVITFDHHATLCNNAPVVAWPCQGMSTNTGAAMELANNWIEEQGASRALMIIVTDGNPDSLSVVEREKARCESLNGYVLGVHIGSAVIGALELQFHDYVKLDNVADLPRVLEPKLEAFISGAI